MRAAAGGAVANAGRSHSQRAASPRRAPPTPHDTPTDRHTARHPDPRRTPLTDTMPDGQYHRSVSTCAYPLKTFKALSPRLFQPVSAVFLFPRYQLCRSRGRWTLHSTPVAGLFIYFIKYSGYKYTRNAPRGPQTDYLREFINIFCAGDRLTDRCGDLESAFAKFCVRY